MHGQSMPSMRQQAIEDQLLVLWRTLPVKGGTDPEGVLEDYQFALQDCSAKAVENTVNNLRAGKIEEASKDFCPKAPKLAEYARSEQRRLDAINRPKSVTYQAVEHTFKDWRIAHRQRASELESQGYRFVGVMPPEQYKLQAARHVLRTGATHFWSNDEVWEPQS